MSLSLPVQDGRLLYLDYIKALAIFLVIVYHSNFVTNPLGLTLLSMCVTLFFAVNGYVMLSKRRTLSYYINKNVKLLFLILFWGFLSDGLQYVLEGGTIFPICSLFTTDYCNIFSSNRESDYKISPVMCVSATGYLCRI